MKLIKIEYRYDSLNMTSKRVINYESFSMTHFGILKKLIGRIFTFLQKCYFIRPHKNPMLTHFRCFKMLTYKITIRWNTEKMTFKDRGSAISAKIGLFRQKSTIFEKSRKFVFFGRKLRPRMNSEWCASISGCYPLCNRPTCETSKL